MFMLNGCGTTLYGRTRIPNEAAYIATEWVCISWIPLIPLKSYIVFEESGTNFLVWSNKEYKLAPLGYIYKPHLKAYFVTALVILALFLLVAVRVSE